VIAAVDRYIFFILFVFYGIFQVFKQVLCNCSAKYFIPSTVSFLCTVAADWLLAWSI